MRIIRARRLIAAGMDGPSKVDVAKVKCSGSDCKEENLEGPRADPLFLCNLRKE